MDINEDDLREEISLQREIIRQLFEYPGDKPNPERVIERGRGRGEEKFRAAVAGPAILAPIVASFLSLRPSAFTPHLSFFSNAFNYSPSPFPS